MPVSSARRAVSPAAFWAAVGAFLAALAFTTVQTPLYGIYQHRDGFPTFILTVIFGVYALGVVAGLWLFGHLSDSLGRRPMIFAGLAAQLPALVISIAWPEPAGLSIGRFFSGLGAAALTTPFTAQITELRAAALPRMPDPALSGILTITNIGGLGLGPIIGGLLAQFAPEPLVLPYIVFAVLLVAAIAAEGLVPETVAKRTRVSYRPQHLAAPPGYRSEFIAASLAAFTGFAVFGLFNSLAPSFVAGQLHQTSVLLGGIVTFSVFAAATVAQVALARAGERERLVMALPAMLAGLALIAIAVWTSSLAAFLAGGIVLGVGDGLVFSIALGSGTRMAPRGQESAVLGAIFLSAYAGLALPAIAVGIALEYLSPAVTLTGFAVAVAVLTVAAIWALTRSGKPTEKKLDPVHA
jgi:MFS family permease